MSYQAELVKTDMEAQGGKERVIINNNCCYKTLLVRV